MYRGGKPPATARFWELSIPWTLIIQTQVNWWSWTKYLYWLLLLSPRAAQSGLLFFIRKIKIALLCDKCCFRAYLKFFFPTIIIAVYQKAQRSPALVGKIEPMHVISIGLCSSAPLSKQHVNHAAHTVLRFLWRPQKLAGEGEVNNKSCLKPLQAIPNVPSLPGSFIVAHSILEALSTMHISRSIGLPKTSSNSTKVLWFWSALRTLRTDHRCFE